MLVWITMPIIIWQVDVYLGLIMIAWGPFVIQHLLGLIFFTQNIIIFANLFFCLPSALIYGVSFFSDNILNMTGNISLLFLNHYNTDYALENKNWKYLSKIVCSKYRSEWKALKSASIVKWFREQFRIVCFRSKFSFSV